MYRMSTPRDKIWRVFCWMNASLCRRTSVLIPQVTQLRYLFELVRIMSFVTRGIGLDLNCEFTRRWEYHHPNPKSEIDLIGVHVSIPNTVPFLSVTYNITVTKQNFSTWRLARQNKQWQNRERVLKRNVLHRSSLQYFQYFDYFQIIIIQTVALQQTIVLTFYILFFLKMQA